MPSRVIRGEILSSDSLSRVSPEAEAFFWRLLIAADDYGRLDGRLAVLRAAVWPARNVTLDQLQELLAELERADGETGPIVRYQVDGRDFIALVNWEEHRANGKRAKTSRFPPPPKLPADARGSPEIPADPHPSDVGRGTSSEGRGTRDENRGTRGGGVGEGSDSREAPASARAAAGGASLVAVDGVLGSAQRRLEARRRRAQYE